MLCIPFLLREAHSDWVDSIILVLRFIKGISMAIIMLNTYYNVLTDKMIKLNSVLNWLNSTRYSTG